MEEKMKFWNASGTIVPHLLYEFFSEHGIGKYYTDESNKKNTEPVIVRINGNIVSPVNTGFLLELTKDHIVSTVTDPGEQGSIIDSLHAKTSLFGEKNLKLLKTLKLSFISDTEEAAYLFFNNGIVEVEGDSVQLRSFDEFEGHIWEKSIIPSNFTVVDMDTLKEKSDFMMFLEDLSVVADPGKSFSRLTSLMSAVGYLLHRYKNPATTKAIILMDIYINGLPNGGSGKTLLMNAIGKVRNLSIIDGKFWDSREWFSMSSVDLGSEVLLFDDVDLNFRFEQIFPLVSTGMLIRRKYKDHQYLPYEKAPKIAITTNYSIIGDSSSQQRRKYEYEVTSTYSSKYSPRDKFGRNFFEGWNEEDWNLFFNVMIQCIQVFLKDGLKESEPVNLHLTKLITRTCEEFVEWTDSGIKTDSMHDKKGLYDHFLKAFPEYKSRLKQREFTIWLRAWGDYKNYQIQEGHSGEIRYIKFICKNAATDPELLQGDTIITNNSENEEQHGEKVQA